MCRRLVIISTLLLLFSGCRTAVPILVQHEPGKGEYGSYEGTTMVRHTLWTVARLQIFTKENRKGSRIPLKEGDIFCRLTLQNTGEGSLEMKSLKLIHPHGTSNPLQSDIPHFRVIDAAELLIQQELTESSLLPWQENCIPPDDSHLFYVSFNDAPGGTREYTIRATLQSEDKEKIIDFQIARKEYRKDKGPFGHPTVRRERESFFR